MAQTKAKTTTRKAPAAKTAGTAIKTAKAPKQSGALSAALYAADGSAKGNATLPEDVFGAKKVNTSLIAQAVRVYRANQRQGTAKVKTRGEVEGSTRKIYKQKGTGRARHGSIRAPIFVGGGIVFGPMPRDYRLTISHKMKRAALVSALTMKQKEQHVSVMDGLEAIEPKTAAVASAFAKAGLSGSILLVTSSDAADLVRAARNFVQADTIRVTDLHVYAVLSHTHVVFTKKALTELAKEEKKA